MHRTQTCTMAEFVWLHIHLENLQLRLFIQNIRSHTSHIHSPTVHTHLRRHTLHMHTLAHSHTRSRARAHTHTHIHDAQINKTQIQTKKCIQTIHSLSHYLPLCNFSLAVKILFHFLLNRPNPNLVLYFLDSILITPLLTHSFLT